VASDNSPDLVYVDREIIGTYAARGAIQPLDDCVSSAKIDMSQYRPAATQQVTVDGKVYGIPEFYSVRVMMINNQAVKEAGLKPADVDTSDWSKLAGMARQLTVTKGDKLQCIGFDPKIPEFLPMWVRANGGAMLSEDGKTAQLNDPKVVEALTTTAGIVQASGGWDRLKSLRDSFDFFGAKNQFVKDQLGAFPMEDWYLNVLAEASPNVGLTVTPFKDRQGNPVTFVTGSAWAIPKGAKNPAAACQFAKTMTEASTWVAAAKARVAVRAKKDLPFTGTYSGNKLADEQIFGGIYKPADNPKFDQAVQTVLSVQDVAFATPPSPAGGRVPEGLAGWGQPGPDGRAGAGGGDGPGSARGPGRPRQGRGRVGGRGRPHPPVQRHEPAGDPLGLAVPGPLGDRVPGLHRRPDARQPGPVVHRVRRDQPAQLRRAGQLPPARLRPGGGQEPRQHDLLHRPARAVGHGHLARAGPAAAADGAGLGAVPDAVLPAGNDPGGGRRDPVPVPAQRQRGLINGMLGLVGVDGPAWTTDPTWIKPGIVLMSLWTLGSTTIIYLAALNNVPWELYEAARLDGASSWRQFRHITVPMISGRCSSP
jgi:multiple sugar transport system substrate-binding protein